MSRENYNAGWFNMKNFMEFIRAQGVVGLAVGFILGGAVAKVVTALINDLISPLLGLILGAASGLKEATLQIGPAQFKWGDFVSVSIDFVVIALVVYFGVKGLGLDKLDAKK
jgi:large conductance mechanosensitive channel